MSLPRLVVAAPASGHGKTTVATGLMAALRGRGLAVSGHKVGPDYIDPGYHALATGRPGRNLDPVLCGEDLMVPLLRHGAAGADIAVIEGVMGLYDGRGLTAEGSTAHVAALTGTPVVLVVDASAQGRSVAALVAGFAAYDRRVRLGGVVLNRAGSDRHEEILRSALAGIGVPVLGVLRRDDAVAVPSRHLGLIPAAERAAAAAQAVRRLASLVTRSVDLEAVARLARTAGPLTAPAWEPPAAAGTPGQRTAAHPGATPASTTASLPGPASRAGRPVVAVAGGAAFTFGYAETTELLTAAGADVATVDPLRDETLPPGTAALVLGGGFPEEYAGELSANERLRAEVARLARAGAPVAAECAGLLYLGRELDGQPMCGVLPVTARMTGRLTLGYRDAVAASESVLAPAGLAVRGHEFHRTAVSPASSAPPAWTLPGGPEGFARGRVHASYLHLHWAGQPGIAARLVGAAMTGAMGRGAAEPGGRRAPVPAAPSGAPETGGQPSMSTPPGAGQTLIGVGVGPGDPELVTVKAVRVLRDADLVLVPVLEAGGQGRAEATVRAHAGHDRIRRVVFALNERADRARREAAWDAAAQAAAAAFARGAAVVAFATIGDPNVYSTFTYLAATVRGLVPGVRIATVPGITAMQDLAARSGTVLCEGTETLALLPLTAGLPAFRQALASHDTVVGYKSGRHLPGVLAAVRAAGRLDEAVHGASLGLPGEDIRPAAEVDGLAPYLSVLLVPGKRTSRGGKL